MKSYPMLLEPFISELVWGGTRLISDYGIQTEKRNAAEAWVLSCHEAGENRIANGDFTGMTLADYYRQNPQCVGTDGAGCKDFPILVKLIDARDDLSVQVHPDDAYCTKTGEGQGKTEAWYVLDCEENACLILGFREQISSQAFQKAVETDTLMDAVQRIPVKKGDCFFIEAGTLHAICKGILLAEVQQNSNTTYRIYDYNRPGLDGKPRELHTAQALAVTKCEPYRAQSIEAIPETGEGWSKTPLCACEYFSMWAIETQGAYQAWADEASFVSLLVLEGEGTLTCKGESLSLQKGGSVFLPAGCGGFSVQGTMKLLESRI